MPFEITTTGTAPFYRGDSRTGYAMGQRKVVTRRASVDLKEARGDVADIITDHRRAANALIAEWRPFYQMVSRWGGEGMLTFFLPNHVDLEAIPVPEGTLRRRVQEKHPQEEVVQKSLRWVVDTYNADQKVDG